MCAIHCVNAVIVRWHRKRIYFRIIYEICLLSSKIYCLWVRHETEDFYQELIKHFLSLNMCICTRMHSHTCLAVSSFFCNTCCILLVHIAHSHLNIECIHTHLDHPISCVVALTRQRNITSPVLRYGLNISPCPWLVFE